MKKIILIGALVGLLAGCYDNGSYREYKPASHNGDKSVTIYQVNGKPLDCISIGAYGKTCNWEKHNKLFEGGISQ